MYSPPAPASVSLVALVASFMMLTLAAAIRSAAGIYYCSANAAAGALRVRQSAAKENYSRNQGGRKNVWQ